MVQGQSQSSSSPSVPVSQVQPGSQMGNQSARSNQSVTYCHSIVVSSRGRSESVRATQSRPGSFTKS
eukprot:2403104-Lingulodinium_polyedra.AAC.1